MVKHQKYPWLGSYPKGIQWEADIIPQTVGSLLTKTVKEFPQHEAINFLGRSISYQELNTQVYQCAAGLQALNVTPGTKVALILPNCPQFVIAYYAICMIGAVVVNCNPLYTPVELAHQLNDAEAEIIITLNLKLIYDKVLNIQHQTQVKKIIVSEFALALPGTKRFLFSLFKRGQIASVRYNGAILSFEKLLKAAHTFTPVAIDPVQDIAVLQYTGGTTGVPKGAMLTHANIYSNAVQTGMWFEGLVAGEEKILGVLPLFHVFAMTVVMNLAIHKACSMVLYPRLDLKALMKDIGRKKPTVVPGVPTLFTAMAHFEHIERYRLSSIKMCISGGAPLPLDVKQAFESVTKCSLVEGYGLTESSPVVSANPLFGKQKAGSIGLPFPATVIEIRSVEDNHLMKEKEIGEICIIGPQVMKGYYKQEEQTHHTLKEGRLHTGDLGYIDEEGYVFVVDRLKDMIIVNGFNVYPREVEEALYAHPKIQEAAVIGVADQYQGQAVKAYVVLKKGCEITEENLRNFLKERITKYKLPTIIEFRENLPKTMIGKISKKDL